ncbi:hypothetical protein B566_EDAN010086 [Ephemera danica]|nr:hypothetical protein B566_EDAN010086 [Ephemera danica]
MLSPTLDEAARTLLRALVALQDKAHARDPDKARMRRRMLTGLHEAKKALILKKVTLLIVAPDLERCPHPGGLDSKICELVSLARNNQVNYTFCLGRRKLGHVLLKKVPVSCVAIVNADAAESELSAVISLLPGLQEAYQNATSATPMLQAVTNVVAKDVNKQVVSSLLTKLEQSLQPPKSAAFLQAIEAAEDSE